MTVERQRRGESITFSCDAPRCAEVNETGRQQFTHAIEQIKSEGWVIFKVGDDWRHICPDHNNGDMSRADLEKTVAAKQKWKPRWAR